MKTISEEIVELEGSREIKLSRMTEITNSAEAEDRELTEAEALEFDTLENEIRMIDGQIRKKKVQAYSASTAKPVDGTNLRNASLSRGPTILVKKEDPEDQFPGQSFVRRVIAKANAHMSGGSFTASQFAEARWGKTHPTLVDWIRNADVSAGSTSDAAWAGRLATVDSRFTGDFIEYLAGMTVYDKLALRQIPHNVTVKGQDGIGTAYWTGQGKAAKMTEGSFTTVNLSPLKVTALTSLTNELIRDSSPSAEALVRDGLAEAIAQRVDQTFFSTDAAVPNESPAGIFASPLSALNSAGADAAGVRADILQLYQAFLAAKNASGLVLCMNPALAKTIGLMVNALGQTEFPGITSTGGTLLGDTVYTGDNIDPNWVALIKPSEIWRIGDLGIQVSISQDASLEMSDSPSADSVTPTGQGGSSQKVVSMFQTDSTAFKIVRPINFQKRRSHAAQYINDAVYNLVGETT